MRRRLPAEKAVSHEQNTIFFVDFSVGVLDSTRRGQTADRSALQD
jgi:hypothetical protein